ncbi:MAG: hypothetical protein HFH50_14370 [Lachnospiraceae bacterium]|jgi:hypothetical protein|nr:hypothetical protein [Lachnospiraceae bacterium]MCI8873101.1 hypothetical protein [Lachnospiraceae bacterium]
MYKKLPDCPVDVSEGNPAVLIVSKHTMIRNLPFFEPNEDLTAQTNAELYTPE